MSSTAIDKGNASTTKDEEGWAKIREKLSDISGVMEVFGTTSATSLQRAYPDFMCTGYDQSKEDPQGDSTDSLFLALRDKTQLTKNERRKQRQTLEMFEAFLAREAREELAQLRIDDDEASDTSEISINRGFLIGADGEEEELVLQRGQQSGDVEVPCGLDCLLQNWSDKTPIDIAPSEDDTERALTDENSGTNFLYATLPRHHIRVLEVEPDTPGMPLACSLHILDLNTVPAFDRFADFEGGLPKYEALSYHWGSAERTCSIICGNEVVKIPRNLFLALHHLRHVDRSRYIWADALCINQSDNSERSAQVRMMLKVYKKAFRVLIWLGIDSEEEGELALKLLNALDHDNLRHMILKLKHSKECLTNLRRAYTAAFKVFGRSWFRRTWIRQELAAGRKVVIQCGLQDITWSTFKRSSKRMSRLRKTLKQNPDFPDLLDLNDELLEQNIFYLKRRWTYGQSAIGFISTAGSLYYWHGGGLLDLLLVGGKFESTDARDKIYGVLGLAREPIQGGENEDALYPYTDEGEASENMVVNYDHTISEVYQRLAKHFINRDLNLDILCILGTYPIVFSSDLPSWTPDWRIPWNKSLWDYLQHKFFASGYIRAEHQDQKDLGKLEVKVYLVDRVVELLDVTTDAWKLLYENGEEIIKSNGALANETEWRHFPVFEKFNSEDRKRCCLTQLGHVALVPPEAIAGDLIFVVLGARLPFVLRSPDLPQPPTLEKQEERLMKCDFRKARIVGPCCLPGFMLGEIFSDMGGRELLDLTLI